jgi:lipopolysaccharide biosynthesis glycosyltransferase
VINLKKWRLDNIEDQFIQFLIDYNGEVVHNDQGIINGVLQGKILIVNPRYNLLSTFYEMSYYNVKKWYGLDNYYSSEIISYSKDNPVFIHFVNFLNGRQWVNDKHPLYKKYNEYAMSSPFKDSVYIGDNRPFKLKFASFLSQVIPLNILILFYKIYRKFFIKYF